MWGLVLWRWQLVATLGSAGLREWSCLSFPRSKMGCTGLWKDMCCQLWGLDMRSQPRT